MATTTPLELEIILDDKGAVSKVRMLGQEVERTGKKGEASFKRAEDSAASMVRTVVVGAVAATAALHKAYQFMASSIRSAAEAETQFSKMSAVIKASGGSAGYTAKAMADMAAEFQKTSVFSDDMVMSAQAVMLTFGSIGREQFPRAMRAAMDLATVMGGDLNGAVLQLGKALEDPANGLTMLRRAGVVFTQEQQDMIKALAASGDAAKAQDMVLGALERKLGGTSAAAMDTFAGKTAAATNQIDDFKEAVGRLVTENEAVRLGLDFATDAVRWFNEEYGRTGPHLARSLIWWVALGDEIGEFRAQVDTLRVTVGGGGLAGMLEGPGGATKLEDLGQTLDGLAAAALAATQNEGGWKALKDSIRSALESVNKEGAAEAERMAASIRAIRTELEALGDLEATSQEARPWWAPQLPEDVGAVKPVESGLPAVDLVALESAELTAQAVLDTRIFYEQEYDRAMAEIEPLRLMNAQLFADAQVEIERAKAESERELHNQLIHQMLGNSAQLFNQLGQKNMAMFRVGQALSVANATMYTYEAANKALAAYPPPWSYVAAAAAITYGLAQVAQIANQKPAVSAKGFEAGTPYVPRTGLYQLHEGERVVPRNVTAKRWGPNDTRALGPNVTLDFSGAFIDDERTAARLASMVGEAMRRGWD